MNLDEDVIVVSEADLRSNRPIIFQIYTFSERTIVRLPSTLLTGIEVNPKNALHTILLTCCLSLLIYQGSAVSQDAKTLQADYDAKVETWRKTIKQIRSISLDYQSAGSEREAQTLRKQWVQLRVIGRQQLDDLEQSAVTLFEKLDSPPRDLVGFVHRIQGKQLFDGHPHKAYEIGKMILNILPSDKEAQLVTARAAIRLNHFAEAEKYSETLGVAMQRGLDPIDTSMFAKVADLKKSYERELEIQEAEADDNLPRVRLETSKGTIVVELFENEAPSTVGNFLALVEDDLYDNMLFNRVVKDYMALTGQFYSDGRFAQIPYTIKDECKREDARSHFRGSLSMAITDQPDSGYCQFFICERALPHLDGKHTVFGRIISGDHIFDQIAISHITSQENKEVKIPNVELDYIISAEIIRKRDHDYPIDKSSGN